MKHMQGRRSSEKNLVIIIEVACACLAPFRDNSYKCSTIEKYLLIKCRSRKIKICFHKSFHYQAVKLTFQFLGMFENKK